MNISIPDKPLAELLALTIPETGSGVSSGVAERRNLLQKPISALGADEVWELLKIGMGEEFLVPAAIQQLESDRELFGLLTTILRTKEFPLRDFPDLVIQLREVADAALRDLDEWDGDESIAVDAMKQRIPILSEWLEFELRLSSIRPKNGAQQIGNGNAGKPLDEERTQ